MTDLIYHHSRYADVVRLVGLKQRQGIRISLVIPTLNEAEDIGRVVSELGSHLMGTHRLLDELVVVDSGSTDLTREIARQQGADVVLASEWCSHQGKGANMWVGLQKTTGGIVAYCDADLPEIHSRYVTSTVGPLLEFPALQHVKTFNTDGLHTGRVTELTVRPLLDLWFPALASVPDPICGECAARREVLEAVPFPAEFGAVEVGLLIDIAGQYGLKSIAHVDLDHRVHRAKEVGDLTGMARAITRTISARAGLCEPGAECLPANP